MSAEHPSPYAGQVASLLTRHGKERVIAPALLEIAGCRVLHTDAFDTDRLGTFTGDIPRFGSQLDAARRKARIGMELTGLRRGLASEGAFSPDPYTGLITWNYELVLLIDDDLGLELHALGSAQARSSTCVVADWPAAERFVRSCGFPDDRLVIRPHEADPSMVRKGLGTEAELRDAFDWAIGHSGSGQAVLEHDLRADANPARMENIRSAAITLAQQMRSRCPACTRPGYWSREVRRGLPCRTCGAPTREVVARIWSCLGCDAQHEDTVSERQWADPARCDLCNP